MIGRRRTRPEVVVYTRAGCGLCRHAEELATREAPRAQVRHVDIDTDPDLQTRYGVRVPVITVDGVEVAELEVAPGAVRRVVAPSAVRRVVAPSAVRRLMDRSRRGRG